MRVTLRTFAMLRELSADRLEVDLADGASMADAWAALASRYPAVEPHRPYVRGAHNGSYAGWDVRLADGDEVAFLPPVSGGASLIRITDMPIDVAELEASVARSGDGAIVTFVGRARDTADDGRAVLELDYEAYAEMATGVLAEIAAEAEQRWGASVAVMHRTGLVPLGEAAVAIVTATPHRAEAYAASRHIIEAIKQRLPIWKRERFADGSEWKRPGA
ncbi:MAG TPA: molybdenum cofactor biosynthesis protein MoaE [Candidatus Limnocylindria bacterium]|jgi:molybdopterin synthase catalytic subunit|nr:molybdenum cofactor biosynthesis protein MoaE [Candidatus Limnocylindria bacterium]